LQTGIDVNALKSIFEQHFQQNADGKMNRKSFRDMYYSLTPKDIDYIDNLSKNVFKTLGAQDLDKEQISFNEFLMTFVLTSRCDVRKKLEYVFDMYDVNNENVLEAPEVNEIILGILQLHHPFEAHNVDEIAKDCFKKLKITEVIRKSMILNFLVFELKFIFYLFFNSFFS
jgi:Ca2+-binding EF-hand superfamily protein